MTARYEYGSFGEMISTSGATYNAIGYTGQWLDAESGLMPLGNGERYYSPELGRFIQQDSWTGMLATAQSMNRFAYGYNNPFRFTDPSGNIADDNRGSLANSAREFGLNKNGENGWFNIYLNWQARNLYDAWDFISLGSLSREEENMAAWEKGEITTEQARWNTFKNGALATAKVGLMVATAGTGNALIAGAGLATRITVGAGLGVAEQFGSDLLEMGFGFREEFSSAGNYAFAGFTGGLFGAATPGRAATAYARESKMTLGTELKFLKSEAAELGQSIGQRLNPRNYNFKLNHNVLGSNGGGFEIEFKPKTNVSDKGIPTSEYKSLRSKTPNQKIRDTVNPEGAKTDPVYGYSVEKLEADHIVSMKEITKMPGFNKLTEPKRVEVLNLEENFIGLGKRTNASKGARNWTDWNGHKELGEVPPEVRQQMLLLEKMQESLYKKQSTRD